MTDRDLDRRSRDVLMAIIAEYVQTAEPVGSRSIARPRPYGSRACV